MTKREIQAHLQEIYGVEVSPTLVSNVTEAVQDEVRAWQNRPLEPIYPIVYMDALYVRMRDNGHVQNRAVYVPIGVNLDGHKEVLGLWTSANEGAKFWLQVMTEMKNRGVQDVFIACVDGLKGFPEAIEAVFPKAQVQLCIVHLVRHSLNYVSWKQRRRVAADLRPIYAAATADEAARQLERSRRNGTRRTRPSARCGAATGRDYAILRVSGRHSEDCIHDERARVAEHELAQDHQHPRLVSERRRSGAVTLPRAAEPLPEVDVRTRVARGLEPLSDPVAGTHAVAGASLADRLRTHQREALASRPDAARPQSGVAARCSPARVRFAASRHCKLRAGLLVDMCDGRLRPEASQRQGERVYTKRLTLPVRGAARRSVP